MTTHPRPSVRASVSAGTDRPVTRRSRPLIALVASAAALVAVAPPVLTTVLAGSAPYDQIHVGFPGLDIAVVTTVVTVVADLAATLTIGALVTLLFLREARGNAGRLLAHEFEVTVLRVASAVWSLAAGALIGLEMFDANGVPPAFLTEGLTVESALDGGLSGMGSLFEGNAHPQAWAVSFAAASTVAVASLFVQRWTGLLIPLWASAIGLLAPVVVGQILVGPSHDFGSDSGGVQAIAAAVAGGVLLVAALRIASGRLLRPRTLKRLFAIVAGATGVVLLTDAALAGFKLQGEAAPTSVTAAQIATRLAALSALLALLAIAAVTWRRRRLTERRIAVLSAASALAATWWVGWTAGMTRIPPPQYFVPTSISQNFLGFDVFDPPSLTVLLTHWRPNLLFAALGVAGITGYVLAVRVLARRGDPWPPGRTVAWVLGWAVVVIATSSGFGKYSGADFGVHMVVHMSLSMLGPLLLVLGGFVTLLLRASAAGGDRPAGLHQWITWALGWPVLRFLDHPLLVFVLFIGSYYALYFSGLFEAMVRYHWAHQLMNLHFLVVGYLYYGLAIGVDRPPRPLPHVGKLGFVLAAMPFHAFFGVILMTSEVVIAETFYRYLALPWADLPAAQYIAGGVAWAAGEIPLLIVVIALGVQWARQDAREAARSDRHDDSGLDDEFDEYNRMLAQLSARRSTLSTATTPAPPREGTDP
jgi:putative copper resistance protein D